MTLLFKREFVTRPIDQPGLIKRLMIRQKFKVERNVKYFAIGIHSGLVFSSISVGNGIARADSQFGYIIRFDSLIRQIFELTFCQPQVLETIVHFSVATVVYRIIIIITFIYSAHSIKICSCALHIIHKNKINYIILLLSCNENHD